MKRTEQYIALFLIVLLLNSCFKKEQPLIRHAQGNIETVQIEIGYPYLNQVYYSIETNKILKTNTRYDWDLSFECSTNGYHVLTNTAKGVFVAKKENISFTSIVDTIGVLWHWDDERGNLDSTVMKDWQNVNTTYIIDRKYNASGNHLGFKKMQILNVSPTSYSIKYANLDGSSAISYTVQKDPTVNFIHFNFDNGGQTLKLEPQKENWDLLFTNHYHKFSNLPMPFVLTQVLINKHSGVTVAESNDANFETLTIQDTANYLFTNYWDEIGYDWKIRNSQDNSYTIDGNKCYIIRAVSGYYYKIRFIDFYNNIGVKGYPKFEIQKL